MFMITIIGIERQSKCSLFKEKLCKMKIVMTELKCSGAQDVGGKTEMKILNWEI